jgi:hypothetical protein
MLCCLVVVGRKVIKRHRPAARGQGRRAENESETLSVHLFNRVLGNIAFRYVVTVYERISNAIDGGSACIYYNRCIFRVKLAVVIGVIRISIILKWIIIWGSGELPWFENDENRYFFRLSRSR